MNYVFRRLELLKTYESHKRSQNGSQDVCPNARLDNRAGIAQLFNS